MTATTRTLADVPPDPDRQAIAEAVRLAALDVLPDQWRVLPDGRAAHAVLAREAARRHRAAHPEREATRPGIPSDALAAHEARLAAGCPCHDEGADHWAHRRGPSADLARRDGASADHYRPGWVDHDYRLPATDQRPETWVAEPYWLHEDALVDLAWLAERGWQVTVSATRARHYPGHTVAVELVWSPVDEGSEAA